MKGIKVSILIPMWNVRSYIERSVQSVYNQTYKNIECILIDDGSTDGTYDELQRVLASLPSSEIVFRPYRREENKGVAATRNELIDKAEGDYIFWLDADDWLELDAIEALVAEQQRTNADIVTGLTCNNDNKDDLYFLPPREYGLDEYKKTIFSSYNNHSVWNRLIRTSIVQSDVSTTDGLECGEDWLFMTKVALKAHSYVQIRRVTYHYYLSNPNSLYASARLEKELYEKNLETYKNLKEIRRCVNCNDKYVQMFDGLMLDFLFWHIFIPGIDAGIKDVCSIYYPLFIQFPKSLRRLKLGRKMSTLVSSPILIHVVPFYFRLGKIVYNDV